MRTIKCTKCHQEKTEDLFFNNATRPSGKSCHCRECAYSYATTENNQKNALRARYKVSVTHYQEQFELQGGKCLICKADGPGYKRKSFCIDHNHETGKIRGLLCYACNLGLGKFKDDAELLIRAAEYLKSYH